MFNDSDRCLLAEKCHRDWLAVSIDFDRCALAPGIFPDSLKIAKVILLYNRDRNELVDNYHPFFLLSSFSMVFQKVAYLQLINYFKMNKLLHNSQYSYRGDYLKESPSLELINRVRELDNKRNPIYIYIYIYIHIWIYQRYSTDWSWYINEQIRLLLN